MEAMPSFVGGTLWKVGLSKCKYIASNVLNSKHLCNGLVLSKINVTFCGNYSRLHHYRQSLYDLSPSSVNQFTCHFYSYDSRPRSIIILYKLKKFNYLKLQSGYSYGKVIM